MGFGDPGAECYTDDDCGSGEFCWRNQGAWYLKCKEEGSATGFTEFYITLFVTLFICFIIMCVFIIPDVITFIKDTIQGLKDRKHDKDMEEIGLENDNE